MKILFLKSKKVHIRTNEGEFEVSNPEVIRYLNSNGVEWPYGVELIDKCVYWSFDGMCHTCKNGSHCKKLARLIPKEKKENKICIASHGPASTQAESDYKEWDQHGEKCFCNACASERNRVAEEFKPAQPTPNFPKGGTTFTESAYKEFDKFDLNKNNVPTIATDRTEVESPEPQEPTAYQKRKAIEKRAVWLKYCLEIGFNKNNLDNLEKVWDEYHDEFGNLIQFVSAPSESQEEHAIKFAEWMMKERWYNSATDQDGRVTYYQQYTTPSNRVFKQIKALYDAFKLTRNP